MRVWYKLKMCEGVKSIDNYFSNAQKKVHDLLIVLKLY